MIAPSFAPNTYIYSYCILTMEPKAPDFKHLSKIRKELYIVVFGTHTRAGKLFDVILLWTIVLSIVVVMLESVRDISADYGHILIGLEWTVTIFFTVEYAVRLFISRRPRDYAWSYFGIIDLLALLPTYLSLFVTGGGYLIVVRALRLLRIFRILKLTRYVEEASMLTEAMRGSLRKILIFMGTVFTLVIITGTLMYMIEGGENGFTSIPKSIYWAVVTVTTVGYGDIAPQTVFGQFFATILMLMGYAIIAVPTGIMTSELSKMEKKEAIRNQKTCVRCNSLNAANANYCIVCGEKYPIPVSRAEKEV